MVVSCRAWNTDEAQTLRDRRGVGSRSRPSPCPQPENLGRHSDAPFRKPYSGRSETDGQPGLLSRVVPDVSAARIITRLGRSKSHLLLKGS